MWCNITAVVVYGTKYSLSGGSNAFVVAQQQDSITTTGLLWLLSIIRQYVASALQQVVSEEEAPEWVLDSTTHLNQVLQNVLTGLREWADINHAHCD